MTHTRVACFFDHGVWWDKNADFASSQEIRQKTLIRQGGQYAQQNSS